MEKTLGPRSRTRSKQAALSTATNWAFTFVFAFFTQPIPSKIGFGYGFILAAYCICYAVFVFFMRETQRLTLEQVDLMYQDDQCKPWNSRTWCPPGYSSRQALVSGKKLVPASREMIGNRFDAIRFGLPGALSAQRSAHHLLRSVT